RRNVSEEESFGERNILGGIGALLDNFSVAIANGPGDQGIGERTGAEIRHFQRHVKLVCRGEHALLQAREWHHLVAKFSEFFGSRVSLALPKRIQQSYERRALAGVIVQVQ